MLDGLTPGEFDEWLAYESLEPFWFDRAERQWALIAASIGRWIGVKDVEPKNFMICEQQAPDLSPKDMAATLRGVFGGYGNWRSGGQA